MIRRLDIEMPQVVAYDIKGKVTTEDVQAVHADLRAVIDERGSARFLADVRGFEGAEPSAVMEDLKLTPEYVKDVERYAVIGDRKWQKWLTEAGDLVTRGAARYFPPEEFERARERIQE
jgi:hypothetical protein